MSTLSSTYYSINAGLSFAGSGPESRNIGRLTKLAFDPLLTQNHVELVINDLYQLLSEAQAGEHVATIDQATFTIAKRFLMAFPKTLPAPELSLDKDGEISFDWLGKHREMFSLSLRADGRLSYAAKLGTKRSFYGIEEFDDEVPARIVESIKEVYAS